MIVEPDPANAKLLAVVLQKAGFRTHAVGSAEAALDVLATIESDVLITELDLPVMTGLMLIEAVRATRTLLPIVVATSNHGVDTKRQARAAGCNKFTAKPIETATFGAQIVELIGASK